MATTPTPPDAVWNIRDEALRTRARTAWEQAHTLIAAVDDWEAWTAEVGQQDWQALDFGQVERANRRGDEICHSGRAALRALQALCLQSPAFAPDAPDAHEGTALESATPGSWWPYPPGELLDRTWYYSPPAPERDCIAGTWVMMRTLRDAAQHLIGLLATVPEGAFTNAAGQGRSSEPQDETTYRPAAELIGERASSYPKLHRLLKSVNRERVVIRTQSPSRNRLLIHVGDWHAYWAEYDRRQEAALDDEALAEKVANTVARTAQERGRSRGK